MIATHTGWTGLRAVGAKVPASQGSDLASTPASVTLSWNASTLNHGTVTGYHVYRSTTAGVYNLSAPLNATPISADARSVSDSTVVGGETYYYTIASISSSGATSIAAGIDSEIKVIVPPENMVLLHRWMANQEMCGLMGKSVDRSANYRCAFSGPGGTGTHLDVGASLLVDAYEAGCNYTYSPTSNKCGAPEGCIGTASTPNGVVTGAVGDVYYSRSTTTCFVNNDGATSWTAANVASSAQRKTMVSSRPGLPPFAVINQFNSQDACTGLTATGFAGTKRLLKRREQMMVTAPSVDLDDATIETIENGINLHATHHCNTNFASPQGSTTTDISGTAAYAALAFDDTAYPAAINRDTLPACLFLNCAGSGGTGYRSLRTGSNSTRNCVSRYGAQDMTGNVWEWTSDQLTCSGGICTGGAVAPNVVDATNDDFAGLTFNNVQGPWSSGALSTWGMIQLPLGIPIVDPVNYTGDGVISRTATQFHGDQFAINPANHIRGGLIGGSWTDGGAGGRYLLAVNSNSWLAYAGAGFRCAMPAE